MSDIRNPLTGRVFKQVDSTVAEILVDAGVMVYNRASTAQPIAVQPPKENNFTVGTTTWGKLCLALTTPSGAVMYFSGEPAHARDAFKTLVWSGAEDKKVLQGPEVPEAIIREYTEQHRYTQAVKKATFAKIQGR
jgi:hypothetical protein